MRSSTLNSQKSLIENCKLSGVNESFTIYRQVPRNNRHRPTAVTIGNFDGVHRGHQAIVKRLISIAKQRNLVPAVVTFEPHPRAYFGMRGNRPELIPAQVNGLRDKATALACLCIEQLIVLRFDHLLADMSADTFIRDILVDGLNTRWLLVGEDFRYGHKRSGDIHLLRRAGRQFGFEVEAIADVVGEEGYRISSSDIRAALAHGSMDRVERLLGRPYQLSGHVIHGRKLGRNIGYPTLNVRVPERCAARSGVYVARVRGLAETALPGVASLGVRPTVDDSGQLLLEVHLFDCNIDAYGKLVQVELLEFLRDEEKFSDLKTMMTAIDNDAQCARDYFALHGL